MTYRILLFLLVTHSLAATIITEIGGQLGNQLFILANAIAIAEENHCEIYCPTFKYLDDPAYEWMGLSRNYHAFFHRIPNLIQSASAISHYAEPDFNYHPIPYTPHMKLSGYFQSEKYFKKYRDLILKLFAPPAEIEEYLQAHYSALLEHPNTVAVHVRTAYPDQKRGFNKSFYIKSLGPDIEYFKTAMEMFDSTALFVIFSDNIDWCIEQFKYISRNVKFISEDDYVVEFCLLSKCKHAIISNSTFGWWGAWLNKNPDKRVICRWHFMGPRPQDCPKDIICDDWIRVNMTQVPPAPHFDDLPEFDTP